MKVTLDPIDTHRILDRAIHDHVKRVLEGLRCREHGAPPKFMKREGELEISGCCEALVEAARKRLGVR